jgi:hypothetical protein
MSSQAREEHGRPRTVRRVDRRWASPALLTAGALAMLGCGGASVSAGGASRGGVMRASATPAAKPRPRPARRLSVTAKMDASGDRIIAEGKIHIAAGAPSDAEVRREIAAARKAGIVLPTGNSAASFENAQGALASLLLTPETAWDPRSKPIASWIVPILEWAARHGWGGSVTSGYRTLYEQAQLNAAGAFSAPAGLSNHETTKYPGGAVDVTAPGQLLTVLRGYRGTPKLIGGVLGPVDPEHFSATGD